MGFRSHIVMREMCDHLYTWFIDTYCLYIAIKYLWFVEVFLCIVFCIHEQACRNVPELGRNRPDARIIGSIPA